MYRSLHGGNILVKEVLLNAWRLRYTNLHACMQWPACRLETELESQNLIDLRLRVYDGCRHRSCSICHLVMNKQVKSRKLVLKGLDHATVLLVEI